MRRFRGLICHDSGSHNRSPLVTNRFARPSLVLAAALALLAASPRTRADEAPAGSTKAAKKAAKETERATESGKAESKREKKRAKDADSQISVKDRKRRELIESGAKTALEWYGEALALYQKGRYLDARAILLPLEDSARAVDIQEKVKLLIADTYFEQGGALNLTEALARYKSFLTFFPSSENAAYAQYQLGRSYFKQLGHPDRDQSFTDQAIFEYQKLIDNYPDSEYVAAAQKDVLEAKARRAQHEFEVAQFYWDWNDKTAAAKRLEIVLKERPELPMREKALWMCAQALYDTGKREEGDAYAARLAADYPGSAYTAKLNPDSPGAIEKQVHRRHELEKETERTHHAQQKADMRRTRIVRKDSGLPGDVPQTWDAPSSASPAAGAASGASSGAAASSGTGEPKASAGPTPAQAAKQQKREEADRAEAEKREREEQQQKAKAEAQEKKKAGSHDAEAAKAAAKHEKEAAEQAAETPEQKAKREKAEAQHAKETERLEAEDQKRADKLEATEAKKKAKQDAEASKKSAKKKAKGKG
jgi:outer membrane protein assembly factor BamD